MGIYFHFKNRTDQYVLSVHHCLTEDRGPVRPTSSLSIVIQQPSPLDIAMERKSLLIPRTPNPTPVAVVEERIREFDSINYDFGTVQWSESAVRVKESILTELS